MDPKSMRIVFMGTPDLAAHCLNELIRRDYHVVGVVTAPDKPAGRGRKTSPSAVKQIAQQHRLPLLQPERFKSPEFLAQLKKLEADVQVVVAFRMLPREVWSMPPLGTFNLHASLLPNYRGAAPIHWVLINGEKETGVTTFLLDQQIDTGKILFREKIALQAFETAGSLLEKVKHSGAGLVIRTLDALARGTASPLDQEALMHEFNVIHSAPKLYTDDCRICWKSPCMEVCNHIHGLSPQPGAFCEIGGTEAEPIRMRIFKARPQPMDHRHVPGTLFTDHRQALWFTTPDGVVKVLELQMPGKKRMSAEAFLRGSRIREAKSLDDFC